MVEGSATGKPIAGIVLAGGQAKRLGGDKPLRPLGAKPLLAHAISRAAPQVATLALSVNGDPTPFRPFGLPILADSAPGFAGPLAGIVAGMDWAASEGANLLASFACDAPFFPLDLVECLRKAAKREGAEIAIAASAGRRHPVFALWPVSLRADLRHALADEGVRKVEAWCARFRLATVDFAIVPFDPFFNVNTPMDLGRAETLLGMSASANIETRGA